MKKVFLIISLSIWAMFVQAQDLKNYLQDFKKDEVCNVSISKKRTMYYLKKEKRGYGKQLSMEMRIKDSVLVYLDDSLVYTAVPNPALAGYNAYAPIKDVRFAQNKTVTLLLLKRKRYIQFKLKKDFYFVSIYFHENSSCWSLKYTNNIPSY